MTFTRDRRQRIIQARRCRTLFFPAIVNRTWGPTRIYEMEGRFPAEEGEMAEGGREEVAAFLSSGIYRLGTTNDVLFVDSPRLLNDDYTHFRLSASAYYERPFPLGQTQREDSSSILNSKCRKRKRKEYVLNERERTAQERHQVVEDSRPFFLICWF